jgi:ATP-binding cassette, subfamily B, multidrug efflux pump
MKSLRKMLYFTRPYRWVLILGLATVVLPVVMELVVPRLLQYIIDDGIRAGSLEIVVRGSLLMLGSALLGALATLGQGYFRAQLSQGIAYDVRNNLFAHILSLSSANLDQMQTGRLMTRLGSDVDAVRGFISAGLSLILRALLMIVGSMIMMLLIDWQLSLVMFIFLALAGVVIRAVMQWVRPLFARVQQRLSALNTIVQENLAGVRVVKAYVREEYEIERFEKGNDAYLGENIRAGRLMAMVMPMLLVLTNVGTVVVIWMGGLDVISGRLTVGEVVAFINYILIGMAPLLLLSNMLTMASRAEVSAGRILEVLATEPLVQEAPVPHRAPQVQGDVHFEDVSFHYHDYDAANEDDRIHTTGASSDQANKAVLDRIHFAAKPGQRVALLGATGAGKSTLVNLIARFYDVAGGAIRIDGVDARHWGLDALRARIGIVPQQTTLFSGTVRENIAYGRPDAALEAVMAAAKAAQAHDFIMAMPQGYDSEVEARGANLSGGQKQRIAIARALLIDPNILILDDSTSAVDLETELQIQSALDNLQPRPTTFLIAQRISSVINADQILVLEDGQIAARGVHEELLQTSPLYLEIYQSQYGEGGDDRVTG